MTPRQCLNDDVPRLSAALALAPGDARLEVHCLLSGVTGRSRAWLLAHDDEPLEGTASARYADWLSRRLDGEPVAYILGAREFYGRSFTVAPGVLIPRPETELLVDAALQLELAPKACVADLGVGSGVVGITLALERPGWNVAGLDRSVAALHQARNNARQLGACNFFPFLAHWLSACPGDAFDLLVANPPYIAEADPHLACGDLRHEPSMALVSGPEGLNALREIVADAPRCLKPGGWLLLEHGYDQAPACAALLAQAGFTSPLQLRDLAGLPRISGGQCPG